MSFAEKEEDEPRSPRKREGGPQRGLWGKRIRERGEGSPFYTKKKGGGAGTKYVHRPRGKKERKSKTDYQWEKIKRVGYAYGEERKPAKGGSNAPVSAFGGEKGP